MSVRENILDNIVTTLKGINQNDDYNENVGLVTREPNNWNKLLPKDKPAIMVLWRNDEKEEETIAGQYILSKLNVVLRGVYYAKDDIEGKLNDFLEDIEKIMCVDGSRGAYAEYTVPRAIMVFQGEDSYNIIFDFDFTILYTYVYGAP